MLVSASGEHYLIDFDEAMLDFSQAADDIVPERKTWHVLTHGPLDRSRSERWRTKLPERHVALIERVLAKPMAHYGYEQSGIGRAHLDDVAQYHYRMARRTLSLRHSSLADKRRRRDELQPVAAAPETLVV